MLLKRFIVATDPSYFLFSGGKSMVRCLHFVTFLCQKVEVVRDGPLLLESENQKESPSSASAVPSDLANDFRHKRSSSRWNDDLSPASSTITESTQAGELISGSRHPMASYAIFSFTLALSPFSI